MTSRNLNQVTVAGRRVLDIPKTGVPANTVPSTGTNGPGYLYNEVVAGGLTTEEVCGRVVNTDLPAGWYAYTDSSLYVPPGVPDGSYFLEYGFKINGVPQVGTGILTITIGDSEAPVFAGTVTVTNLALNSYTLTWSAATDNIGIDAYEYNLNATGWVNVGNVLTTNVTGRSTGYSDAIQVRARDAAGNTSNILSASAQFIDSEVPVLTGVITVSAQAPTSYTLTWPAGSDNVAVTAYEYSINGGSSYTSNGTALTVNVTGRPPGYNDAIRVRARDAANNVSTPSLLATATYVDSTLPILTGTIVKTNIAPTSYTLSWPAASDNVIVTGYQYNLNASSWVDIGAVLTFDFTGRSLGYSDSVQIRAKDLSDNFSTPPLSTTVNYVDTVPPTLPGTLTVSALAPTSYTLSWSAASDNVAVTGYQYNLNSSGWVDIGNVLTVAITGRPISYNDSVQVRAKDALNNFSVALSNTAQYIDNVPPVFTGTITVTSLAATSYTLIWPAATDNIGVTSYQYNLNNTGWLDTGNVLTTNITGRPGGYSDAIQVRARDAAGNVSTALSTTAQYVDAILPVLTGTITLSNVTETGYTANWPAATDNVAISAYQYNLNNTGWTELVGLATSFIFVGRPSGYNDNLQVRARDAANNVSSPPLSVNVQFADTVAPSLVGTISVTNVAVSSYTITWPAASDNVGVASYEYSLNSGGWSNVGNVLSVSITSRPPSYSDAIQVRARDASGNVSSPPLSVTVNGPVIDVNAPNFIGTLTVTALQATSYTVSWPAATDNIAVTGYQYRINSGSWVTLSNVTSVGITGRTPNSTDIFEVRAFDAAINYSAILSTTVNLSNPVAQLTGPSAGTVGSPSSIFNVTFDGSYNDSVVVTPTDGGNGGVFIPNSLTLTTLIPSGTFVYVAATAGLKSITTTNNRGFVNAQAVAYTASIAATPPVTTSSKAMLIDLRAFIADSNLRRSATSFSLNFPAASDIALQNLSIPPASSRFVATTMNPSSVTMLRTSLPLTAQITMRDGEEITVTITKLLMLDSDVASMNLINVSATATASITLMQG